MKFKDVVCNRSVPWRSRIRFFEAIVTPTALYGCAAWTMTDEAAHMLTTTRRKMLRWMFGARRRNDEEWVDFIRRATHDSEASASEHGACDWMFLQRKRKWQFAGSTARRTDGRWSTRLLAWRPHHRCEPFRRVGRPVTRWDDDIVKVAGVNWVEHARDEVLWNAC